MPHITYIIENNEYRFAIGNCINIFV